MTLPLLFGANVDPLWSPAETPLRHTLAAERLGLDLVTIQDHPYQAAFYDAWTLLSYLAGRTERITLVPTVATLPLRPPAILAKSAASLDQLTGGRVQLGLGAGAFWDAIAAMGGPQRGPREAVEALDDADRDPTRLRKIYNISGLIGPESTEPFRGSVKQWTELLVSIATEHRMNGFVFWPAEDHENQMARFAQEVAPAVRAAIR